MPSDTRSAEEHIKTAYLNFNVWYNPETRHIHMALPNSNRVITTINDDPKSERGHPNLYQKLARALRDSDVPHPPINEPE